MEMTITKEKSSKCNFSLSIDNTRILHDVLKKILDMSYDEESNVILFGDEWRIPYAIVTMIEESEVPTNT